MLVVLRSPSLLSLPRASIYIHPSSGVPTYSVYQKGSEAEKEKCIKVEGL